MRLALLLVALLAGVGQASNSTKPSATANKLPKLQTPLYALYLCSHPAPAASFFGFNHTAYSTTGSSPPAAATRRTNATSKATAARTATSCPAVDSSFDVDSQFTLTVRIAPSNANISGPYLEPGVPYLLSFLRKPALGAVDVTFSVHLDDGARPDSALLSRRTVTLSPLSATAPAGGELEEDPLLSSDDIFDDVGGNRRLLVHSSGSSSSSSRQQQGGYEEEDDDQPLPNPGELQAGGWLAATGRHMLKGSSGGSSGGSSSSGRSSGSSSGGSSGGGRGGGSSGGGSGGGRGGGSSGGGSGGGRGGGSSGGGWTGGKSGGARSTTGGHGGGSSGGGDGGGRYKNIGLTGWARGTPPVSWLSNTDLQPASKYKGTSGGSVWFGGYLRYSNRPDSSEETYPTDGMYDYDGEEFYVPPEEAAALRSTYWRYPPTEVTGALAYGLPDATSSGLLAPGTAADLPTSRSGRSVFKKGAAFQYQSDLDLEAAPGAPQCAPCDSGSCCGSTRFANANWDTLPSQANRKGVRLTCGLQQDVVLNAALYLPTNAKSLTVTIHSIFATLNASTPCGANASATADPREPPLYVTLVPGEQITPDDGDLTAGGGETADPVGNPTMYYYTSSSAAAPTHAAATKLLQLLAVAVAVLMAAALPYAESACCSSA